VRLNTTHARLLIMTQRDVLIREIDRLPDNLVREVLAYMRQRMRDHGSPIRGNYASYWNRFIGVFSDQEWERPTQGFFEDREV
jgi:hypothetical protein